MNLLTPWSYHNGKPVGPLSQNNLDDAQEVEPYFEPGEYTLISNDRGLTYVYNADGSVYFRTDSHSEAQEFLRLIQEWETRPTGVIIDQRGTPLSPGSGNDWTSNQPDKVR